MSYNLLNLNRLHGAMMDEPCVILGNGPSLGDLTDDHCKQINKYFSIGLNNILQEKRLKPTCWLGVDKRAWDKWMPHLRRRKMIKFGDMRVKCDDGYVVTTAQEKFRDMETTPEHPIIYAAMSHGEAAQLAYWAGCNPIIYVGVDCCYRDNQTSFYGLNPFHNSSFLDKCERDLIAAMSLPVEHYVCSEDARLDVEMLEQVFQQYPPTRQKHYDVLQDALRDPSLIA